MARNDTTVRLNIQTEGLEKTIESLKTLASSSTNFAAGAKNQLNTTTSLLEKLKYSSKISAKDVNKYLDSFRKYNNDLAISFEKHNQKITETKNKISKLDDELTQLKEHKAELESRNIKKDSSEKLLKKSISVYSKGQEGQENQNIVSSFTDYKDVEKWSRKKIRTDTTDENKRKIEVARQLMALTKELAIVQENAENKHKQEIEDTNNKIKNKNDLLEQQKNKLNDLQSNTKVAEGIQTEIKGLNTELGKTSNELEAAGVASAKIETGTDRWKKAASTFMRTGYAAQFLRRAIMSSIQSIRELDKAITNMTVVTGKSREETEKYVDSFVKIAKASSSTITEIASLTTEYVRQGRTIQDAMTLAEETAKAAKIAGISTADSITYMTSAINGFNLSAKDASHVSDVFAKVAAESATSYSQLAIALSKVSAQANQAGLDIEYTTALLAKGIETTQEAPESIGTALKTIIARFRELRDYGSTLEDGVNVNQVEAALSAVGIAARDSAGNFRNLDDILNELGPRWDSLTSMQRQAIAQAAAGTRQQSRFLSIMQDWERTMQLVNKSQNAAGASAAQYSKYAKGLEASITNLKSTWQGLITSLTDSGVITSAIDGVSSILTSVSNIVGIFGKGVPYILTGIVALVAANKILKKQGTDQVAILQSIIGAKIGIQKEDEKSIKLTQEKMAAEINDAKIQVEKIRIEKNKQIDDLRSQKREKEARRDRLIAIAQESEAQEALSDQKLLALAAELEGMGQTEKASKLKAKAVENDSKYVKAVTNKAIAQTEKEIKALDRQITSLTKSSTRQYDSQIKSLNNLSSTVNKFGLNSTLMFSSLGRSFKNLFSKENVKVMLIMATVTIIYKTIESILNITNDAMSNLAEFSAAINDNSSNISSVKELAEEYDKLSKSINKTAEEEKRLQEIIETMENEYDTKVDSLEDFQEKINEYNLEIARNMENSLVEGFKASILTGENLFEKAEFKSTLKLRLQNLNEADTSTAKGKYQSDQYIKAANRVDTQTMASNILKEKSSEALPGNVFRGIGGGVASVGAGIGAATLAAAGAKLGGTLGTVLPGLGNIIGLAVGAAGGLLTYFLIKENSKKYAQEAAEEIARQTAMVSNELNDFSRKMSDVYDKGLATQYELYTKIVGQYSDVTQQALTESNRGFEILKKLNVTAKQIKDLQGYKITNGIAESTFSDEEMTSIIEQAGELGDKAGQAFVKEWLRLTNEGKNKQEIASSLIDSISYGSSLYDSVIANREKKLAEQQKLITEANVDLENLRNSIDAETFIDSDDKYKKYKGMNFQEIESVLRSNVSDLIETYQKEEKAIENFTTSLLETISSFDTLQELGQGLTSLNSSIENSIGFADRLEKSETTIDDWVESISKYQNLMLSEEWKNANDEERANLIRLTTNAFTVLDDRSKMIDNWIMRINKEAEISKKELEEQKNDQKISQEEYDNQIKAIEDNTKANKMAAEELKKLGVSLSNKEILNIVYERSLAIYDKNIENGDIKSYLQKIDLVSNRMKDSMNDIDNAWNQYAEIAKNNGVDYFNETEWKKMMNDLLSGNEATYNAWLKDNKKATDGAKAAFKTIWETYSADYDAYKELCDLKNEATLALLEREIEVQNTLLDKYKARLEEERDALQESLDKRKELYEKYFDSLEEQESDETFEEKQYRLLNAISTLSTSTDATSLQKLKEYQEELNDLQKEQLSTERERRKDATLNNIDNQSEALNQYYEERLENEQNLWEEISSMAEENVKKIMTDYNSEFKNATELNQAYLLSSYKQLHTDLVNMLGNNSAYIESKKDLDNYTTWLREYTVDRNIGEYDPKKSYSYSTGGIVDYTGLAMVHGTTSKPEAFLNSSQTAMFSNLATLLDQYYSKSSYTSGNEGINNTNNNITIDNLNIEVDATLTDNNMRQTGESLADALIEGLRRTGISVNMKR